MSDLVFPALPAMDRRVVIVDAVKTEIQEAASGVELRPPTQATPRIRWEMHFKVRTGAALQEAQTLRTFWRNHGGRRESFLFNCPVFGSQYRVRFDSDELEFQQEAKGVLSCTIDLISVL
jgi:hypothetical protein